MGMYTQIRGWLNVDSIGGYNQTNFKEICDKVEQAKEEFGWDDSILDICGEPLERKWVCNDTCVHGGGNGSVYIFIGTELKNYGCPAEIWIKYLLNKFPNAEGRIDFQYEEDEETCKCWEIYKGKIAEKDVPRWCYGYGNQYGK